MLHLMRQMKISRKEQYELKESKNASRKWWLKWPTMPPSQPPLPRPNNPRMSHLSSLLQACTSTVKNSFQSCFTVLLRLAQEAGSWP